MNNIKILFRRKMPMAMVALAGLMFLSPVAAMSEQQAAARVNDVVAESWADEQEIANMIMNRVNAVPSVEPSYDPTRTPTSTPSNMPSVSAAPSSVPSFSPTISMEPTSTPSSSPSVSSAPSDTPSSVPSSSPTAIPSASPSISLAPSESPSSSPSISAEPTPSPSESPSSTPSDAPSEEPTFQPTKSPTSSPSRTPTDSPTMAPTTSAVPSSAPTIAKPQTKDMYLIDDSSSRSTSLLIIGACAFIAVASTGVYLYRRSSDSMNRRNHGYGAPITEVSADRDFDGGAGVISPMSRVSGLPRFSYDPNEHKAKKQKTDNDTDIELGEIPRSVYVSTPNTSVAISDPYLKENAIIKGVQKYFGQTIKAKKPSSQKGALWDQIRDEGSPACSSGIAPASIPSMFSPVLIRGLPALLHNTNVNTGGLPALLENGPASDSDRTDVDTFAIVKSGSAESYSNSRALVLAKTESKESYNSGRSTKSHITSSNRSAGVQSNSSSKYGNLMKAASAYSNATKSIKSKNSFFPLSDDDTADNDEVAAKSSRSHATNSVKSYSLSKSDSKASNSSDNISLKSKSGHAPSFDENISEIKNILNSISDENEPLELYKSMSQESKESKEDDVPMSYSQTPPNVSPQSLSDSCTEKAGVTRANDVITPQFDEFNFDANFDNVTIQTEGSGSCKDKETPRSHGAQLLSPITYEKELKTSVTEQEFSFRNLLSDPHNELYECHAPPGPLGIVIDSTPLGPRVKSLNPMSSLFDSMSPGDIIVGIDDIDTVGMEAAEFWQLVSRKANQRTRILTMLKI